MDAKDIKEPVPIVAPGTGLAVMMTKQQELVNEYIKIEGFNPPPWDLRLKENQIELKNFMFRVIEEMGEAYESFLNDDMTNFWTELADATHFLLEIYVVTGQEFPQHFWEAVTTDRKRGYKDLEEEVLTKWFWQTTYRLDLLSNSLRNKQWKQTEVMPDMHMFKRLLYDATIVFFQGFISIGRTEQDIFEWYFKKNEVNKFRIRSKY